MTDNVAEQLGQLLTDRGAAIVACADLAPLPPDVRNGLPYGLCIGVPLNAEIIATIQDGPTREYAAGYVRTSCDGGLDMLLWGRGSVIDCSKVKTLVLHVLRNHVKVFLKKESHEKAY